VDHAAGILLHAKQGASVTPETALLTLYASQASEPIQEIEAELLPAFQFSPDAGKPGSPIIKTVM
jgi:thymidine phosphorylase